jgi:hypothetical protein
VSSDSHNARGQRTVDVFVRFDQLFK